jgi:hypothetical protein
MSIVLSFYHLSRTSKSHPGKSTLQSAKDPPISAAANANSQEQLSDHLSALLSSRPLAFMHRLRIVEDVSMGTNSPIPFYQKAQACQVMIKNATRNVEEKSLFFSVLLGKHQMAH